MLFSRLLVGLGFLTVALAASSSVSSALTTTLYRRG